jgi:hypothetical protein
MGLRSVSMVIGKNNMKFKMNMVKQLFHKKHDVEKFNNIKDLGFTFQQNEDDYITLTTYNQEIEKVFDTLDDLLKFVKKYGPCMLTTRNDSDDNFLTIVNDYM